MLNGRKKSKNQGDISLTLKKAALRKGIFRIKTSDCNNKYDNDSIMNEQGFFLLQTFFNEKGGVKIEHINLKRYIVIELDNNEKEMFPKDIFLDKISKVIKILNPNKSVIKNSLLLLH